MVGRMAQGRTPHARGRAPVAIAAAAAFALLAAAAWLALGGWGPPGARPAPGLGARVDAAGLAREGHVVVPAVLTGIYAAFAETDEAAIYDGLARVAAGPALEALYLERAGALAEGGLPDQKVHDLSLLSGAWRAMGETVHAEVRWAVLGEVGHAEHVHLRGNAYGARLTIAPTEAGWRLTGFELTDVDRSEVGTLVAPDDMGGTPGG
jgi:hypothetical protein